VVLYCLGITQVDPIAFGLSAERFLNPKGVALPNIDVDFDVQGRERVLQWMVKRFGEKRVANIVTHHRSSSNFAKQMVAQIYETRPSNLNEQQLSIAQKVGEAARHSYVHACGVALCAEDISNIVPLAFVEDPNYENGVIVTQYRGNELRRAGVVVLYLLSLQALDTVKYFAQKVGVAMERIPLDDAKTFEALRRGETEGLFQFDSEEMRQYLREEQPSDFEGLVAILSHHCSNRAHTVSYTLLAYQMAYLKVHYPEEFARSVRFRRLASPST
jgi:DNA polymerase-3 subunit alpha